MDDQVRILLGYATYQNKKGILIGYAMLNDSAFVSHAHWKNMVTF